MKIRDLLNLKDFKYRAVVTVRPDEAVTEAIAKLTEHDRGALPVCGDNGELMGIITERDILRKCFAGGGFVNRQVQEVMTEQVAVAAPEDDVDYAIEVMKQKRIRHIPIMDGETLAGMISMRDLMGIQYEETRAEIRYAHLFPRRPHFGGTRSV